MTYVVQSKPVSHIKEGSLSSSENLLASSGVNISGPNTLGYFANESVLVQLYERLYATQHTRAAASYNAADKFSEFREVCLEVSS